MYILAPSILGADFTRLGEEVKTAAEAGAQYIHLDVMDGNFVPNISFGVPVIEKLRGVTDAVFDAHLMVEDPDRYVEDFAKAGADLITVHAEATKHLHRTLEHIRSLGKKAGVALNPATSIHCLENVLDNVDMILLMTVNPGFGGQKFILHSLKKIRALKKLIEEQGKEIDIQVDGGITLDNLQEVMEAGANIIVAGSSVYKGDVAQNVKDFLNRMESFEGK